jgi:hypothetical protein
LRSKNGKPATLEPRLGKLPGHFALQQPPGGRVQLEGRPRFFAALFRGGAQQLLYRAFRFVCHNSYPAIN